jgi:hypothetical protein
MALLRESVRKQVQAGSNLASKDEVNPAELIQQSRRNGEPGIIFVAINCRL